MIRLPYPISANRYWRTFQGRTVRSKDANDYKRDAAWLALAAGVKALDGPVSVTMVLHPRTTTAGAASKTRMDLDNCIKVTLDALNSIAYRDDSQVVRIAAAIGEPVYLGALSVTVESAQ